MVFIVFANTVVALSDGFEILSLVFKISTEGQLLESTFIWFEVTLILNG